MSIKPLNLLSSVPDFTDWKSAVEWIEKGKKVTQNLSLSLLLENDFLSLDWRQIQEDKELTFGYYPSEKWRKFVLATFLADLTCYTVPVDQVNFDRLLFIMHAFPVGFRVWWLKLDDSAWWPVGYTGWYPMYETMFNIFEQNPESLRDRMVAPDHYSHNHRPFLNLFNYSIVPSLRKTCFSKKLMKAYSEDIHSQNPQGLACFTVSDDGRRVANRFGMSCSGYLKIEDSVDGVFVGRL